MNFRENLLAYLNFEEYEKKPVFLNFTIQNYPGIAHLEVPVCERPMHGTGYDVFGVHWTDAEAASHYTPGQPPIISDIEQWQSQLRIPKVSRLDWEPMRKQAESIDRENNVVVATLYTGPFERTSALSTFEDCLCNIVEYPDEYGEMISALADYKIDVIDHVCRYGRPDIINFHDDWGMSNNTFMSMDLWRQTIKPHAQRIYDAAAERGVYLSHHSCGVLGEIVDEMVGMGLRCWEGQRECNDMDAILAKYGDRLRINYRPDEATLTPEELAEYHYLMDTAKSVPEFYVPAYKEKPEFLFV